MQIVEALQDDAWWRRLPFARAPQVLPLRPSDVTGLRDATGLLTTRQDVTPMALAHQALLLDAGHQRPGASDAQCDARAEAVAVAEQPAEMLYLEPDDEITAVVRRIRASSAERIDSRCFGTQQGNVERDRAASAGTRGRGRGQRTFALVADPASRALAAEAGIAAFASVADAAVEGAVPHGSRDPASREHPSDA